MRLLVLRLFVHLQSLLIIPLTVIDRPHVEHCLIRGFIEHIGEGIFKFINGHVPLSLVAIDYSQKIVSLRIVGLQGDSLLKFIDGVILKPFLDVRYPHIIMDFGILGRELFRL